MNACYTMNVLSHACHLDMPYKISSLCTLITVMVLQGSLSYFVQH